MKIAVLGTGMVGEAIASRLVELGHEVAMGARTAGNDRAAAWAAKAGARGRAATFAEAAAGAELIFNCTLGTASLEALRAAGPEHLEDKTVVDVSNPLDFSTQPPSLALANTDSLAEKLQRELPGARIVKALNTMNAHLMVHPRTLPEEHVTFLAGNHAGAKDQVTDLLKSFGWRDTEILDLGDIGAARGLEAYLLLWLRIWKATGTGAFNLRLVRGS